MSSEDGGSAENFDSSDNQSGGDRSASASAINAPNAPAIITAAVAERATAEAIKVAKASGASIATVRLINPGDISLSTFQAMVKAAGMPLRVYADSLSANGQSVEARIIFDPAKANTDLNLSASVTNNAAQRNNQLFTKYFSNMCTTVNLGQQGSFGQLVEIAVKPDLSKLDVKNLIFYAYNRASNTYTQIQKPEYWVDGNGYLHFHTVFSGDIVITDKPLTLKK